MDSLAWGRTGPRTARIRATQTSSHQLEDQLSLIKVLHESPRVLELLSPYDKQALSAVCTSSRQSVHAFASSISLQEDDTLQHLLDTAVGPRLQKVTLHGLKLTVKAVPELTSPP